MRAVYLTSPGVLDVVDIPQPELPAGGIIVSTAYAGVCGSDVRTWLHGNARLSGAQVLGHEVAGVVKATDSPLLNVGDRVAVCPGAPCGQCGYCQVNCHNLCQSRVVLGYDLPGAMAESFGLPQRSIAAGCVVKVPEALDLRAAVLAEPLHTVFNGQNRARVQPGDSVLVLGLGAIGTLHVALAQSRGASRVLGLDLREDRVAASQRVLGEGLVEELTEDLRDLGSRGGPDGWDLVILAAGSREAMDLANSVVAPNGRILAFAGMPPGDHWITLDLNRLHYKQHEVIGAFGGTPRTFQDALNWLAQTSIDLNSFVTDVFALERALDAFDNVQAGRGLKTVIAPHAPESST